MRSIKDCQVLHVKHRHYFQEWQNGDSNHQSAVDFGKNRDEKAKAVKANLFFFFLIDMAREGQQGIN